jgi:hypothetical protein
MGSPHGSASRVESPLSGERSGLATGRRFSIAANVVREKSYKCRAAGSIDDFLVSSCDTEESDPRSYRELPHIPAQLALL